MLADVARLWRVVDPDRFDETHRLLTLPLQMLVDERRRLSAGLAANYYRQVRREAGITSTFEFTLPGPVDREQLATSLTVTGPVARGKALRQGANVTEAARRAFVATSGSVSRHALDAGRETVLGALRDDPKLEYRWYRVTSGTPCDFCQMLAGRGAVYREDTAGFKAHDHCGCYPAPSL